MVVQHNMQAMNANRMLNVTTGAQAKSTEKLSSGYKINRAADDAAGLSISEKMRKQIRGLDQASSNAQDGVSAVQTAEGALTEVHSMLQRMNELAVQASNGTNSESDRQSIQDEIDQLTTEIDRVAETTKFNETYLLKGNAAGTTSSNKVNAHDAGLKGKLENVGTGTATFTAEALSVGDKVTIAGKEYEIAATSSAKVAGKDGAKIYGADGKEANITETSVDAAEAAGTYFTGKEGKTDSGVTTSAASIAGGNLSGIITATSATDIKYAGTTKLYDADGNEIAEDKLKDFLVASESNTGTSGFDQVALKAAGAKVYTDIQGVGAVTADDLALTLGDKITADEAYGLMANELAVASSIGTDTAATVTNTDNVFTITEGSVTYADKLSFNLHVGADADMTNKINVDIETMNSAYLGVKGINIKDATGTAATYAIDAIADAVAKVSAQRSALGAVQNRLEHTIANVDNVVENSTSAESRIRDTDMAEEMVNYSKNNILAQAGQSMLAQANQSNQGVLSLLG